MRSTVRRGLSALMVLAIAAGSVVVASSAQASANGWIATPTDGQTVGTATLHVTGVLPSVYDHSSWWVDSGAPTTISAGSTVDPVPFDFAISGLAPGEHRIFVSLGPGEGSDYVDIVVDPPPSIVITDPTGPPSVPPGTQIPFSATITDSNFVSWTIIGGPTLQLSGSEANLTVSLNTSGWSPGPNMVYLTATDTFGSASVGELVVYIDYPPPLPPLTPPIIPITTFPPPNPSTPPTNPNAPTNPTPPTNPAPTSSPTPTPSTSPSASKPANTLADSDGTQASGALPTSEPTAEPTAELTDDPASERTDELVASDPGDPGIPVVWIFGGIGLILAIALGLFIRFLIARRP